MKKFVLKTTGFITITIIILSVIGVMTDIGLRKTEINEYSEIYRGGIDADLLICGNSRAFLHISPTIIDSTLTINSFNIGLDGQPILMQMAKYDFYNKYNKEPRYIIYCVDEQTLTKKQELFGKDLYLPFLNDTTLSDQIKQHTGYHIFDFYNPFTKYIYKEYPIEIGMLEFFNVKQYKTPRVKGYLASDIMWDNTFDAFKKQCPNGYIQAYTKNLFPVFERFIKEAQTRNIKVVLVWTPQYFEYQNLLLNKSTASVFFKKLSGKYNIPFLDYSNDSVCYKKEYFYNSQHLNKVGSELFSQNLANDLKELNFIQ